MIELRDNANNRQNGHEFAGRNKSAVKKVPGFFRNYCLCLSSKVEPDDANGWTAEKYESNGGNGWTKETLTDDRFAYRPSTIIPITIDPAM